MLYPVPLVFQYFNTGTKYVRIMKKMHFEEKKEQCVYHV